MQLRKCLLPTNQVINEIRKNISHEQTTLLQKTLFVVFLTVKRRAFLNGESDLDSGHGEISDTSSDIDTVMTSRISESPRLASPSSRYNLSRSNSDVAALIRRGKELKGKIGRSYSAESSKIKDPGLKQDETTAKKEGCKSPRLAHMKLNDSQASSRRSSFDRTSERSLFLLNRSPLLKKSNLSKGAGDLEERKSICLLCVNCLYILWNSASVCVCVCVCVCV